jgi:hypothetical protein
MKNISSGTHLANGPKGTGAFLGERYSKKEVIAFGGISAEFQLKVRSSSQVIFEHNLM